MGQTPKSGLPGQFDSPGSGSSGGNDPIETVSTVDCLGATCPRPQLLTKIALSKLVSGEMVDVLIDSPSSKEAIPPMLPELDASLLETVENDAGWVLYIVKN